MTGLPAPIAAFDDAQRRGIALLDEVVARIQVGMTPEDIARMAQEGAAAHGFDAWFHAPEVQRGAALAGGWKHRLLRKDRKPLDEGELVAIDLGPATADAFADVARTVQVGRGDAPRVLGVAQSCMRACLGYASRWKTVGEVQVFAQAWAVNHRMEIAPGAVGHRVLPREGWLENGWPRSAHLATLLRRNQVHRLHPVRMSGMFAIRPVVCDPRGGVAAVFEEIVWIDGEQKRILGRDEPSAA
jgi:methionine aminopeptidase